MAAASKCLEVARVRFEVEVLSRVSATLPAGSTTWSEDSYDAENPKPELSMPRPTSTQH
jgi:hypothetical protein